MAISKDFVVKNGLQVGSSLQVNSTATFSNNVTISGNLTVSGTTTYVNTATLNIADNIVTLNADVTGATAPSENAGLEVNRGSSANVQLRWNETTDSWEQSNAGLSVYYKLLANNDILDSLVSTSITVAASANSVKAAYDTAISQGSTAYSNATTYASNATNISSGTLNTARLPAQVNVSANVNAPLVFANVTGTYANITGQVNTATFFAATSANVGGNVQITVSQYGITGNVTTAPTMSLTGSALTIGNSTITGAPSINLANSTGNTTVNVTSIGSSWGLISNASGVYHSGLVNAANFVTTGTVNTATVYATGLVNAANFVTTGTVNTATVYATGQINAASYTTTNSVSNTSGFFPISNAAVGALGNSTSRWIITANSITANGLTISGGTITSGNVNITGYVNASANLVAPLVFANVSAGYANVTGQVNTATLFAATSANVGGNVQITVSQYGITGNATTVPTMSLTASALTIGNSTVTGAPSINLANSTGNTTVNATSIGTSWGLISNASGVYHSGLVNAASLTVGSSFIANLIAIVGTGYANVTGAVNASSHTVGTTFTANATLVNTAAINIVNQTNTATLFATTSANVGGNVQITVSQFGVTGNSTTAPTMSLTGSALTIGNSTITGAPSIKLANSTGNTTVNVTSIGSSWGLISNASGVYHSGLVNAASHTTTTTVSNTTGFFPTTNAIALGNSIGLWVISANSLGANSITVTGGNLNAATVYATGQINATSHTVGSGFIANLTAIVGTGYANVTTSVNTALFTVGTAFTANATLVNAAAINIVNQVNTATLYAITSANVGANVQLTTSQLFIGNSTVNATVNSSALYVGNSTSNVVITANSNAKGTRTILSANATNIPPTGGAVGDIYYYY